MSQLSLHNCEEHIDESQHIREILSRNRLVAAHKHAINNAKRITVHITLPAKKVDPLLFVNEKLSPARDIKSTFFWQQPNKDCAFIAGPSIDEFQPKGDDHFNRASTVFNQQQIFNLLDPEHRPMANIPYWIGGFQFDAGNPTGDSIHPTNFVLPQWIYYIKNNNAWLRYFSQISPHTDIEESLEKIIESGGNFIQKIDGLYALQQDDLAFDEKSTTNNSHTLNKTATSKWIGGVESIKEQIEQREIQKLVLARKIDISLPTSPHIVDILEYLRTKYRNCTTLMMRVDAETVFVASTPEHIVLLNNKKISTESLAGSSSRGEEIVADQKNKYGLLSSEKNLNEHRIVRDDILCQLEGLVEKLSFPKTPEVKQLANVQHLFTPIEGLLKNGTNVFTILSRLHPTPAVGGYPRYNIQQMIKKLEKFDRCWYASPVGWVDEHGNAEFVVAIRCGYISKRSAQLFAGCGIVGESNAQKEWHETNLKFMPLLNALREH